MMKLKGEDMNDNGVGKDDVQSTTQILFSCYFRYWYWYYPSLLLVFECGKELRRKEEQKYKKNKAERNRVGHTHTAWAPALKLATLKFLLVKIIVTSSEGTMPIVKPHHNPVT